MELGDNLYHTNSGCYCGNFVHSLKKQSFKWACSNTVNLDIRKISFAKAYG